jgi:hypothetical protein
MKILISSQKLRDISRYEISQNFATAKFRRPPYFTVHCFKIAVPQHQQNAFSLIFINFLIFSRSETAGFWGIRESPVFYWNSDKRTGKFEKLPNEHLQNEITQKSAD